MKKKAKITIGTAAVLLIGLTGVCAWFLSGSAFAESRRGAYPIEFMFTPFNLGWPADYAK